MAPHSSTLAWKIPWTEEPGGPQSMGSLRVGHDWETSLSLSCIGGGNGNPLQFSCLENPRDGGSSWAAVYGVAQSRTRLKRLSSSSSRDVYWYPRPSPDCPSYFQWSRNSTKKTQPWPWPLEPQTQAATRLPLPLPSCCACREGAFCQGPQLLPSLWPQGIGQSCLLLISPQI